MKFLRVFQVLLGLWVASFAFASSHFVFIEDPIFFDVVRVSLFYFIGFSILGYTYFLDK